MRHVVLARTPRSRWIEDTFKTLAAAGHRDDRQPSRDARKKLRRPFAIGESYTAPAQMAGELAIRGWARHDTAVARRQHIDG